MDFRCIQIYLLEGNVEEVYKDKTVTENRKSNALGPVFKFHLGLMY